MICSCPNPLPCNCHQCTWLRANQFERAFIPQPAPEPFIEPERCVCGDLFSSDHSKAQNCTKTKPQGETGKCVERYNPPCAKPADPVEEKIKAFHTEYMCQLERGGGSYAVVDNMIRELVSLVLRLRGLEY